MPADNRLVFEKQLKDDPFLFEAFEGYMLHRAELESLKPLNKPGKAGKGQTMWLKMVAGIAVFALAAFIFWWINSESNTNFASLETKRIDRDRKDVAIEESETTADLHSVDSLFSGVEELIETADLEEDPQTLAIPQKNISDSRTIQARKETSSKALAEKLESTEESIANKGDKMRQFDAKADAVEPKVRLKEKELGEQAASPAMEDASTQELSKALNTSKRLVKGVILDANHDPLMGANVMIPGTRIGTNSDLDGNFSLHLDSTQDEIEIQYTGFENQLVKLDDREVLNVIMDEGEAALSEITVSGYRATKPDKGTAEPVGGFSLFEKYLRDKSAKQNKISPDKAFSRRGTKKVTLQFTVDKAGKIYDIKVIGPGHGPLNEEAINLLLGGPKWQIDEHSESVQTVYNFYFY